MTATETIIEKKLADQLLERYARHIEAGDVEDLEKARAVLQHPLFGKRINNVGADVDFNALQELLGKIEQAEANPVSEINAAQAKNFKARELLENQIRVMKTKLAKLETERDQIAAAAQYHRGLVDSTPHCFQHHPALHYINSLTDRLKALSVPIPPKPNW